jgi:predicted nucleotidyltransferase
MIATTEPPWLVTPEKVHAVVGRLVEMAHPRQIILFGSYARGKITEDSDLDVLIVAGEELRLSAFMARARQERFAYNTDLPLRQWCLAKPNCFSCATSR